MKKTGQLLKEKREAANLSLSEVALATKINPKVLTAMENGDEAGLPSKTFLKGFLRAYAVFLKMNPEDVLRSYQEESGQPAPEVKRAPEVQKPAPTTSAAGNAAPRARGVKDENNAGLRTAAVIVIVILIGVIIGVRELIEKYQREKQVEASAIKVSPLAQPALVPEGTKAADNNGTAAATTSPAGTADTVPTNPATIPAPDMTAQPAPSPAPALAAAENAAKNVPAPAPAPTPTPPPAAAAQPPPAPAPAPAPKAEAPKAEAPKAEAPKEEAKKEDAKKDDKKDEKAEEAPTGKKTGKVEIILEALDKVDIKFQLKGETKKISLGPTQVHTIHADQPVTLDISDGGAVNVILNGRERGVPGDLGKPKTIKIP